VKKLHPAEFASTDMALDQVVSREQGFLQPVVALVRQPPSKIRS
jgi:hypothetical protein